MALEPAVHEDALKTDIVTTGAGINILVRFYKIGRVATVWFLNGAYTANAEATLITFPSGFEPLGRLDVKETYNGKRIQVEENGIMYSADAFSSTIIRGTFTYLTKD